MRIDAEQGLKEDQYIEIMDVDDVPHGVHVGVEKMHPMGDWTIAIGRKMRDTFMANVITDWSFGGLPAAKTGELRPPELLRELPRGAYRALMKATDAHYIDAGLMDDPDAEKKAKEPESSASVTGSSSG